jgi:hypothetical protein
MYVPRNSRSISALRKSSSFIVHRLAESCVVPWMKLSTRLAIALGLTFAALGEMHLGIHAHSHFWTTASGASRGDHQKKS